METFAKDIMTKEVLKAVEGMTLEEGVRLLVNHQVTGVPVVDQKGKMIGVFSEFDIIRSVYQGGEISSHAFDQPITFSKSVVSVPQEAKLEEVLKLFSEGKYRRLPVVDDSEKLIGIITRRDIIRLFYYRARFGEA